MDECDVLARLGRVCMGEIHMLNDQIEELVEKRETFEAIVKDLGDLESMHKREDT